MSQVFGSSGAVGTTWKDCANWMYTLGYLKAMVVALFSVSRPLSCVMGSLVGIHESLGDIHGHMLAYL